MAPTKSCEAGPVALHAAISPSPSSPNRAKSNAQRKEASDIQLPALTNGFSHSPFHRWRPTFHLIAPKNWMNDPCGPCYDPETRLFHLLYQYNPNGATWGSMSWMHATSTDLVHWRHVKDEPALISTQPHDKEGVFSGSMIPTGPHGEAGQLTVLYTAVSQLPIHYTKPYEAGCEKVALAVSHDHGKTWQASPEDVAIPGPPEHLASDVVAWRDPFIGAWPAMDQVLGLPVGEGLYGSISGSLRGETPTVFLYAVDRNKVSQWTFISHLAEIGMNFTLNDHSGDFGHNWEVCNFFDDGSDSFLLVNVEGVDSDPLRRHAMWTKVKLRMAVSEKTSEVEPKIFPQYSGIIDHGCLYAATTFIHPPTGRRILWGWITEFDLAESRFDHQGWSGCMSLPREVYTPTYDNVDVKQFARPVLSHTFWPVMTVNEKGHRAITVSTLASRPAEEVLQLRKGASHFTVAKPLASLTLPFQTRNIELIVDIAIDPDCIESSETPGGEIGILIAHDPARKAGTKIVFSPRDEVLRIDRSASSTDPDVDRSTKSAPLGLLRFADGSTEPLRMRVFLDNSVLEVFINDRVSITTRIYCDSPDHAQVSLYGDAALVGEAAASGQSSKALARFERVEAWAGLQSAMLPTAE